MIREIATYIVVWSPLWGVILLGIGLLIHFGSEGMRQKARAENRKDVMFPDPKKTTESEARWHEGLRQDYPRSCWYYAPSSSPEDSGELCVLTRGHDNGIHEPKEAAP